MDDCSRGPWLGRIFRRTSCPIPRPDQRRSLLRTRHLLPLATFLVPNVAIGYGVVLPRHGFGGFNEITIGFAGALLGAAVTYLVGVRGALRA